jgi:hypothetical protein
MSHGDRGGSVVKVLCCQSKGRWFDPYLSVFIIIIIIIIFIYCSWVDHPVAVVILHVYRT